MVLSHCILYKDRQKVLSSKAKRQGERNLVTLQSQSKKAKRGKLPLVINSFPGGNFSFLGRNSSFIGRKL